MRLEIGTDQKEGLFSEAFQKPHAFARHEAFEMIRLGNRRRAPDVNRALAIVDLARALPRIAEIAPEVVDLRQPGPGVRAGQLVGVKLRLGSQVLKPIVEIQTVIEAVSLRINKVHLSDQAGDVAGTAEMMRHGSKLE